jgi:hypothetical protein
LAGIDSKGDVTKYWGRTESAFISIGTGLVGAKIPSLPIAGGEISKDDLAVLGPIAGRLYILIGFVFLLCFGLKVAKPGDSA